LPIGVATTKRQPPGKSWLEQAWEAAESAFT